MALDTRWKNPQGKDPEQLWRWAQDLITELRKGDYLPVVSGVTNAQLADMAAWTIKARNNSAAGVPQDVARGDLTAATDPANAHELLGFLSTNELRRFTTGNVGGIQRLNSGTVTSQATLDIPLTGYSAYRGLHIVLSNLIPATDGVILWMRLSTNGGSSYDAGAANYRWANSLVNSSGGVYQRISNSDTEIEIGDIIGNGTAEGISVHVDIMDHTNTAVRPRVLWRADTYCNNDTVKGESGSGRREAAQDTDAVRFLFSSGNIASGKWALYGYA